MRMGITKILTSDNGSEFKNELDAQLAMSLGIKMIFTTPYHPQVSLYLDSCTGIPIVISHYSALACLEH